MRRCWVQIALAGVCAASASADQVGRPLIAVYSSTDTGRDEALWCAVRDRAGAMHFGGDGMLTFDGVAWRQAAAAGAAAVRGLAAAPDGRIYAAAEGELGWFEDAEPAGWSYHSLLPQLAPGERDVGELWNVFLRPRGAVFAATHALYWWEDGVMRADHFSGSQRISAMAAGGRLFVHHRPTGLWEVDETHRRLLVPARQLGGATVVWVGLSPAGAVALLATSRGFLACDGGQVRPHYSEASDLIRRFGLSSVAAVSGGRLALGTLRGGVILLDAQGRLLQMLAPGEGLPSAEVFGLYADDEDGLWAMSSANFSRISLAQTRLFRSDDEAGDHPSVIIGRVGADLVNVTEVGDVLFEDRPNRFSLAYELNRHSWCAVQAGDAVYVGRLGGVDQVGRKEAKLVFAHGGLLSALAPDRDTGALLVAIDRTICRIRPGGGPVDRLVAGLPAAVTSLVAGKDGAIWIGTAGRGVLGAQPVDGQTVGAALGVGAPGSRGLVVGDGRGGVVAFAGGEGWIRRAGQRSFQRIVNLPLRPVVAAAYDALGSVWIVHPNVDGTGPCVAQILRAEEAGSAVAAWRPWLLEGLWRIGVPEDLHVEADGPLRRLWIGGSAGVLQCQIDLRVPEAALPSPRLTLVQTADGAVEIHASLQSLALRPALAVETFVGGVDSAWVRFGSAGRRLAALRPGSYRVQARVIAASGQTGPVSAAGFEIPPPWWRRPWALLGWGLIFLGAASGWHRARSAALRARAAGLEEMVRRRTADLERVTAEKARLVAGISHDIRNPLNGIVGIALALEETELGARQRELLKAMRACAKHLSGMMEDVIDFARLETGRAEVRRGACSPEELLHEAVALVRADAEAAGARLLVTAAPDLPATVLTDAARIRQILVNFLSNAVKFAGGEIHAAAGLAAGGSQLEFSVRDSGPGIARQENERLFQPFVRLREELPGAGLGLATSKRWAELMGGRIALTTELGKGCLIQLFVPCVIPDEATAPAIDSDWRVLLVEDDEYSAWATSAVLARMGIAVREQVRTGAEAVARLEASAFDVVLLDQRLPGMGGREACEQMRRLPHGARCMIIGISGESQDGSWRAAGGDAFVAKPVTPEKLAGALNVAKRLRLLRFLSDGTAAGFERECARYVGALRDLVGALASAAADGQWAEVQAAAHRLQGHFRMLDAADGMAACADLERDPRRIERMEQIRAAAAAIEDWLSVKADA